MIPHDLLRASFEHGAPFDRYVTSGSPRHAEQWRRIHDAVALTGEQRDLVHSFMRRINVLVLSGLWCGDCAAQCPMISRIADANSGSIALRFLDRDRHAALAEHVRICGGLRVPTVLFLNEDFEFVSILGDRTLSRYRALAARSLGASCPLPGAPIDANEAAATLHDWVNEFERVHLLLRLSPKLRERYGD